MQIVIDIPKEIWDSIKHVEHKSYAELIILKATKNGTPLPKVHDDLIERAQVTNYDNLYDVPTVIKADKVGDTDGNS